MNKSRKYKKKMYNIEYTLGEICLNEYIIIVEIIIIIVKKEMGVDI